MEGRGDVQETGNVQEASVGGGETGSEAALAQEGVHSGTVALNYLLSIQKPYGDRTGLGYH